MNKEKYPSTCTFLSIVFSVFFLVLSVLFSNLFQEKCIDLVKYIKLLDVRFIKISYQWVRDFFLDDLPKLFLLNYKITKAIVKTMPFVLFVVNEFVFINTKHFNLQLRELYHPLKDLGNPTKYISNKGLYNSIFTLSVILALLISIYWFLKDVPPMILSLCGLSFNYIYGIYYSSITHEWMKD